MKKLSLLGISLAFALSSAASMAGSSNFQALNEIPNTEAMSFSAMTDKQLAAVEGTNFSLDFCNGCVNLASLTQGNISLFGLGVTQANTAGISQSIN